MGLFDHLCNALSGRSADDQAPAVVTRDYTDDSTPGGTINDRTDFPVYRQTGAGRRCVGACTPDRQPMTHAAQAISGAGFVAGMIDWNRLGPARKMRIAPSLT
jgi:hypothetical protein